MASEYTVSARNLATQARALIQGQGLRAPRSASGNAARGGDRDPSGWRTSGGKAIDNGEFCDACQSCGGQHRSDACKVRWQQQLARPVLLSGPRTKISESDKAILPSATVCRRVGTSFPGADGSGAHHQGVSKDGAMGEEGVLPPLTCITGMRCPGEILNLKRVWGAPIRGAKGRGCGRCTHQCMPQVPTPRLSSQQCTTHYCGELTGPAILYASLGPWGA